jgi:hypothetical protein
LPLAPPLRTGLESCPSSGSSRAKTPTNWGRFPLLQTWATAGFLHCARLALRKVVAPCGIKRMSRRFDFAMPDDPRVTCQCQGEQFRFLRRRVLRSFAAKRPASATSGTPVARHDPACCFALMPPSSPVPECAPDFKVHSTEDPRGRRVPMIARPTPDHGVVRQAHR